MTDRPESDAPCVHCGQDYGDHPFPGCPEFLGEPDTYAGGPVPPAIAARYASDALPPTPTRTEARPCACGHLTNRHNALVSGPCPVLGCDCPDFREPGPEVGFAPEQYPRRPPGMSADQAELRGYDPGHGPPARPPRGLAAQALAELNAYRQVITEALGYTGPGLSHAELRAYAADAIRIARTVPPEVRYGETVTTVDPESGSPADVDPDIHTLASRLESPRAGE
jgi:hypothetical protein